MSAARKRRPEIVPPPRRVEPFTAPLTFAAFSVEKLRELRQADEDARCEELLEACVALDRLEVPGKPAWDPPAIEDSTTDLDVARMLLRDALGNNEPDDWEESRVWREMYLHTYDVADRLRALAQKLDDALDEEIKAIDDHNNEVDALNQAARRLQLDLGL